jgi:type IV pilus assembly protein PilO
MAKLAQTRKRFQVTAWILGIIAAVAGLALVLPLRPPVYEKDAELNDAKLTAKRLESEVGPLRDLPTKLVKARSDIAVFYKERFPDRFSAVPETLGKLAAEHKVRLTDVKYETSDNGMPAGLNLVAMEADLGGDYPNVVHFINALERSKTFFLIDRITLGEEGTGGGVRLQIRIISILRSSSGPVVTPTPTSRSRT